MERLDSRQWVESWWGETKRSAEQVFTDPWSPSTHICMSRTLQSAFAVVVFGSLPGTAGEFSLGPLKVGGLSYSVTMVMGIVAVIVFSLQFTSRAELDLRFREFERESLEIRQRLTPTLSAEVDTLDLPPEQLLELQRLADALERVRLDLTRSSRGRAAILHRTRTILELYGTLVVAMISILYGGAMLMLYSWGVLGVASR